MDEQDYKAKISDLNLKITGVLIENVRLEQQVTTLQQEMANLQQLNQDLRERGDTYKENWKMCDRRLRYLSEKKDNSSQRQSRRRRSPVMYDPAAPPRSE